MTIRERLAILDASNAEWQRNRPVSIWKIGKSVLAHRDCRMARAEKDLAVSLAEDLARRFSSAAVRQSDIAAKSLLTRINAACPAEWP